MVRRTVSVIWGKLILRFTKASMTAISLAAFNTAGTDDASPIKSPGPACQFDGGKQFQVRLFKRERAEFWEICLHPFAGRTIGIRQRVMDPGRRMSGVESCAMSEPSTNSTIECTMLCLDALTTPTRAISMSKPSQRASIISNPLLNSVLRNQS